MLKASESQLLAGFEQVHGKMTGSVELKSYMTTTQSLSVWLA